MDLIKNGDGTFGEKLDAGISNLSDDESCALLLVHEYTDKSNENMVSGALKSIDRARFQTLKDANSFSAPSNVLPSFIAQLKHGITYWDDGGSWLKDCCDELITSSCDYGYLGNEGATKSTTYCRYAMVAQNLQKGKNYFRGVKPCWVCCTVSDLLVEAGDISLVHLFFKNILLKTTTRTLCSSKTIGLLWKWAIQYGDTTIFDTVVNKFKETKQRLLHSGIGAFLQYMGRIDDTDDKFNDARASIVRVLFPDNARVQAFLKWMREKQINASFTLEADGRGQSAYVITITKTRAWFLEHQKKLLEYKTESELLSERFGLASSGTSRKRARHEKGNLAR
ncbi:Hypothetical protein PHPALM_21253 [Phytophthora palmivora]|uniref:Uncharacterized protein n=1 Tax=Phytophthora palmivora TaxID=4796 RepID=A0A2P4XCT7_9STRA|nr:Hypothetical protein PHPALM_21253 [Phytophthora palmivora]